MPSFTQNTAAVWEPITEEEATLIWESYKILIRIFSQLKKRRSCADQEGDRGSGPSPPPWKITKIKGFLAILDRIPWNSQNSQSYQACIPWRTSVGPSTKRRFCWRVDDSPLIAVFGSSLPSPTKKNQTKKKKRFLSWTPSGKTFWIRTWKMSKSNWVWPGNVTITNFRTTHDTARKRNRKLSATWQQQDN